MFYHGFVLSTPVERINLEFYELGEFSPPVDEREQTLDILTWQVGRNNT